MRNIVNQWEGILHTSFVHRKGNFVAWICWTITFFGGGEGGGG